MTNTETNPIEQLQPYVSKEGLALSATEINGFVTGMVCGGLTWEDQDCLMNLQQVVNEGDGLSVEVVECIANSFKTVSKQLDQGLMQLKLAIEEDSKSLSQRLQSLAKWSEGWLLGFGHGVNSGKASKDAIEALSDIKNISQVEFEIEDQADEEMEKAYVEILEHLKVSVEMLFLEKQQALNKMPKPQSSDNIH